MLSPIHSLANLNSSFSALPGKTATLFRRNDNTTAVVVSICEDASRCVVHSGYGDVLPLDWIGKEVSLEDVRRLFPPDISVIKTFSDDDDVSMAIAGKSHVTTPPSTLSHAKAVDTRLQTPLSTSTSTSTSTTVITGSSSGSGSDGFTASATIFSKLQALFVKLGLTACADKTTAFMSGECGYWDSVEEFMDDLHRSLCSIDNSKSVEHDSEHRPCVLAGLLRRLQREVSSTGVGDG